MIKNADTCTSFLIQAFYSEKGPCLASLHRWPFPNIYLWIQPIANHEPYSQHVSIKKYEIVCIKRLQTSSSLNGHILYGNIFIFFKCYWKIYCMLYSLTAINILFVLFRENSLYFTQLKLFFPNRRWFVLDVYSPFCDVTESRVNHLHTRQLRFKDLPTGKIVKLSTHLFTVCILDKDRRCLLFTRC